MPISPLPALDRTSATFRTDLDTFFLSNLPAFSSQAESARVEINANTITAESARATAQAALDAGVANAATNATTATTKAAEAVISAAEAAASVASIAGGPVASINGRTGVVTGVQDTLVSGTNIKTIGGASLLGSGDVAIAPSTLQRSVTGASTLIASDSGKLINASGTFTLSVTAAATLGNGWYCWIRNTGVGVITLDPNGSETVDGVTSGQVFDTILLACNGTSFTAVKIGPFSVMQVLTSGTSWVCPLGVRMVKAIAIGGGGGAASGGSPSAFGGGGGSSIGFSSVVPGTSYSYAIGASGGSSANAGGNSSITLPSLTLIGNGGQEGSGTNLGLGGSASGGSLNINGQAGGLSSSTTGTTSSGGGSLMGFGGVANGSGSRSFQAMGYGGGGAPYTSATQGVIILEY